MKKFEVLANGRKKVVGADTPRLAAEQVTGCDCWPYQDFGDTTSYTNSHSSRFVIVKRIKGEEK